jgi:hypothetical protein
MLRRERESRRPWIPPGLRQPSTFRSPGDLLLPSRRQAATPHCYAERAASVDSLSTRQPRASWREKDAGEARRAMAEFVEDRRADEAPEPLSWDFPEQLA